MPKKKSTKRTAQLFKSRVAELEQFCLSVDGSGLSDQEKTWAYETALIKLSAGFERLMLDALVAAVNNDTAQLSETTKVQFPKHLTDEVCEFLVTGGGYFDFRGRSGLIDTLKRFLPTEHYLVKAVCRPKYKTPIDQLIALRNFAAHESKKGKRAANATIGMRFSASGAWVKRQKRFNGIADKLRELATEIEDKAPY